MNFLFGKKKQTRMESIGVELDATAGTGAVRVIVRAVSKPVAGKSPKPTALLQPAAQGGVSRCELVLQRVQREVRIGVVDPTERFGGGPDCALRMAEALEQALTTTSDEGFDFFINCESPCQDTRTIMLRTP